MTTNNIDELIETLSGIKISHAYVQGYLDDAAEALRQQQKRIEELEANLETERLRLAACGVAALGYFDGCNDEYRSASLEDTLRLYSRCDEAESKLSAIRQAVEEANASQSRHYKDCMLVFKADWKAILDAVKDAPAQQPEQGSKE